MPPNTTTSPTFSSLFFITLPKKKLCHPHFHSPIPLCSPQSAGREKKVRKNIFSFGHTTQGAFVLVMTQSFPLNILYYTGTWRLALSDDGLLWTHMQATPTVASLSVQHSTPRGQAEEEKAFIDSFHQHCTAPHLGFPLRVISSTNHRDAFTFFFMSRHGQAGGAPPCSGGAADSPTGEAGPPAWGPLPI